MVEFSHFEEVREADPKEISSTGEGERENYLIREEKYNKTIWHGEERLIKSFELSGSG